MFVFVLLSVVNTHSCNRLSANSFKNEIQGNIFIPHNNKHQDRYNILLPPLLLSLLPLILTSANIIHKAKHNNKRYHTIRPHTAADVDGTTTSQEETTTKRPANTTVKHIHHKRYKSMSHYLPTHYV